MAGINETIADERSEAAVQNREGNALGYGLAAVTSGLLEVAEAIRDAGTQIASALRDR
ncbi:hypothetical protein [Streptomyces thermolilacinus]|uniref:hypothetical protein n=1 Tax=Streptomyces thermolilacinus TaxID=285540 RepID=UPI00137480F1|nr:hypothetical protein [Streptomyces thermolilacinus]